MRIIFAGTPPFAALALEALLRAGHQVPLVLTQPDRPAGRGMALAASAVKQVALLHDLPLQQPASLKSEEARQLIQQAAADVMIVAAYGLILPPAILDAPRLGCLNIHASLLPRWRGAAPIQRALWAGDLETGITIMQMDAGLDTGPTLLSRTLTINGDDTAQTLHDKLAALGAGLIVEALTALEHNELHPTPQPAEGVTYAAKIVNREAEIDWRRPAIELECAVRALNPAPGATALIEGKTIKIWRAALVPDASGQPGQILAADSESIVVACGHGALRLLELQKPGGKRLPVADFLRGFPLQAGARFALSAH